VTTRRRPEDPRISLRRALLAAALLAACASSQPVTSTAHVIRVVCEDEKPVGSQLLVRRCRTEEQSDLERDAIQRELLRPRAHNTGP
jgi:hypothetical protein